MAIHRHVQRRGRDHRRSGAAKKTAQVFGKTDWKLLSEQKASLLRLVFYPDTDANLGDIPTHLQGLLSWIDAVQDAAEEDGFPVVFLIGDE
jgi:hypothetical protein